MATETVNSYLNDTPVKDLNLDLTTDQVEGLDALNDNSKILLNLNALTNQGLAQNMQVVSGESTAPSENQEVTETTTISPAQILGATRAYTDATDPWKNQRSFFRATFYSSTSNSKI